MGLTDDYESIYPFDDSVADSEGSNDGTLNGAVYTTGINNNCLSFDGTNDNVYIGSKTFTMASGSISFWFNTDTGASASPDGKFMVDLGVIAVGFGRVQGYDGALTGITLAIYNGAWRHTSSTTTGLNDSSWHNVMVTWDNTAHKLYIDGTLEDTTTVSASPVYLTRSNRFGSNFNANGQFYKGLLDEIYLYNAVKTQADVTALYNSGTGFFYPFASASFNPSPFYYRHGGVTENFSEDPSVTSGEGLCYRHAGATKYFGLVDTTDGNASPMRIRTSTGTKAVRKE